MLLSHAPSLFGYAKPVPVNFRNLSHPRIDMVWVALAGPATNILLAFFAAFNVLEALLPSLVSRIAPAEGRGVAIGVYNTTQTLGVFFGGLLGGWVAGHHGAGGVFMMCAVLSALWLAVAAGMRPLPRAGQRGLESDVSR